MKNTIIWFLLTAVISFAIYAAYQTHNMKTSGQMTQTMQRHMQPAVTPKPVERSFDMAQIAYGKKAYQEYCAKCHGLNGEGAVNWRQQRPDGKYPAPPLNGTGHAWHHPLPMLQNVIKNSRQGSEMPAWKDTLNDAEIDAIIAWFQSQWPDEVYMAWDKMKKKAH
ncbi:cytochrome c [Candidatus Halobeggiatoa sp. HSG11]|nr:cytochrome c [Candidatus Halobeggiatoa sp. HSG11]